MSLALLQLLIWLRRRSEVSYLIFSVATLAAAGVAVAEIRMSGATSVETFISGFRLANYCIAILFIALAWFVVSYSESGRRRLAWVATAGWVACALINAARPTGLALAEVSGLDQVATAWGETYTVAIARTDATKALADLSALAVLLLAFLTFLDMRRAGKRRQAAILGAISFFLGLALVHTTLVDLGLLASPYLVSYFFLAIALVTSYQLAAEVARASVLSERVRSDEQRWRSLLEGVDLLVARIRDDGTIDYANPHLAFVSGYGEDELLGMHARTLLPDSEQESVFQKLEEAFKGRVEPSFEAALQTKDGRLRTIVWRNVLFRSSQDGSLEVLSVGADVTAQREAEQAWDKALEQIEALKSQLEEENLYLKEEIKLEGVFSNIIGESEALKYVLFRIEQVAPTHTTVLIQGETGVGKELVARAIHDRSQRSTSPFVRLNCATLPANLVESELFGHLAGAFTDAKSKRVGRFELANGGTLFLDEVGELPLDLQPKLLRVLQDGEFEPVGSSETKKTDVRLIAATNRNLEGEVGSGRFREDLFYRLHVYPITVPPLRDRQRDIPLLVEHFLPLICARVGRTVCEVPSGVLRTLQSYSWPGNVRQLQNLLEESVVVSTGGVLRLPAHFGGTPGRESGATGFKSLAEFEKDYIQRVLEATDGQVGGGGGAAEILGLHPNTLRSRMKKLRLSVKDLASRRP
ncbi:MAG: sigma 54-interacting transcriptional regulator [Thermoanaerobaculia bacterium]